MTKKQSHVRHWLVFIGCCAITFTTLGMVENSVGIFTGPVAEELGVQRGAFNLYLTLQNVGFMIVLLFAGKILSKANIRILLSVSAVVTSAGIFSMSLFTVVYQWYAAGIIIGLSIGFCGFMSVAIFINNWFDKWTGTLTGFVMAFGSLGGIVFNPVGGWMIENFGWRFAYSVEGVFILLVLLPFTLFVIRYKPEDVGLKPYGYVEKSEEAQQSSPAASSHTEGVDAKVVFKSPAFYLLFLFCMTATFQSCFNMNMPGYASSLGYSLTYSGMCSSVVLVGAFVGKIVLGTLNDKLGPWKATACAVMCGIIGVLLLIVAGTNQPVFFVGCIFFGLAFSMSTTEPPNATRLIFGDKDYPTIYSTIVIATMGSGAIATPFYAFVYDFTGSYLPGLWVVIAIMLIGMACMTLSIAIAKKLPGCPLAKNADNARRGVA